MTRRAAALVIAAAAAAAPAGASAAEPGPDACRPVRLPVATAAGAPADQVVSGTLCRPRGRAGTLQVLLSGATYDRRYWNFPVRRDRHSYVAAMRRAGLAVLQVDRLGTGRSSHPAPGSLVTLDAHVHVLHQLVQAARNGEFGARFDRVVPVGHSLGSAAALVEAARHGDVDGLVLTGFLAHADPVGAPDVLAALRPAALEPRFRRLAPDYVTTQPGTRGDLFYHRPSTDDAVVAHDEATKDTATLAELAGVATQPAQPWVDAGIDVPVLSVVGEFDNMFCPTSCAAPGSPAFAEREHYPRAPGFETFVQPRAGHVVNLHGTAPRWFAVARGFIRRLEASAQGGR